MKRFLAIVSILLMSVAPVAVAQKEMPNPPSNFETIKAGSLIIAMDNDKQNIGSLFNVASYGLVVDLLNNNIPVKWAIRAGKTKDGTDFTATVARFAPSAQAQTTLSFTGGPFIVEESYANLARARITAFARNVAVYELKQDLSIDIRYELLFKPRPFVNTTNSTIITNLLDNAGISSYKVGPDFSVENSSCYTIIMEPHNSVTSGVSAIRSFVETGGNFYAQCLSTISFENVTGGYFLSTAGITQADTTGTLSYPNPDLSFSQFIGAVNPAPGGSVEDWVISPGSAWRSGTSSHGQSGTGTVHYAAMQGKVTSTTDIGGLVFYVGGHNYSGTALIDLNGQRLMFNALLTPSKRPNVCNIQPLEIPVSDLTLTKTHSGAYLSGTQDSYSFTVTNIGTASSVDDYTVTDTLAAGLTFVSGSGTGWTFSSSVLGNGRTLVTAVNATSLAINASSTFTITVGITTAAIGTKVNTAYVSGGGEVNTTNNSSSVSANVVGMSGRVFEDLNTQGVEDAGDPGFSGLTVTVVDNGVTFTATTDATGNWTVAGLFPSTTATVTIGTSGSNSILAGATQTVGTDPSTHSVGTSGTSDGGKDGFRDILTNISVTKTGPISALVGDTIQYVITTTNSGPNPALLTTVTDTLPPQVTYISSSRSGVLGSGNVVTWPAVTIAVSGTVVDTIRVQAPPSVAALVNIAAGVTVRKDTEATNNNGTQSNARVTTQLTIPDLSITKTHSGYFTVGADSAYTITITNNGTGPSVTSVVTDTLPAGLTYKSATGVTGTWTFSPNGQVPTATLTSPLAAGASASFKVTVTPAAAAQPSVTNTARVVGARETALGNNSASDPTTVNVPDITVIKSSAAFSQNTNGTYTIKVKNVGTGPSTGTLTVVDSLAASLTYVSTASVIGTWAFPQTGQVVTAVYAASLAPGDSAVFSITVNPSAQAAPSVNNTARVSGGSETNLSNNTSTITTSVAPATDLTMTKAATSSPFVYGSNGSYTITVNNVGGQASTGNIIVTDTLPSGLSYVSGSGTSWGFATSIASGRTIVTATYTGTSLPALTGSTSFALTVLVLSPAASMTNTGWVSGGGDGFPVNNSGSATTGITAKADLSIAKSSPASFTQGTAANYTITVTNIGAASTSGTSTVVDSIPASLTVGTIASPQNGWTITKSGNVVTATSTTVMAQNATSSFTIPVTPLAAAVPSVTNKAVVSNANQVNPANDTAYVTTPVTGLTDLSIAKTSSAMSEGSQASYTITIKNIGTAASSGTITVLDTLAANITYISSTSNPAGWTIGAVGQVVTATSSGVMAVGDSAVITLTIDVGNVGTSVTNRARVSGGNDSNTANNLATVTTTVGQKADLTVSKTSSTFTTGQTNASYDFVVSNIGSVATTGAVTVVDTLPAGVTYVSGGTSPWTVSAVGQVVTATAAALNLGAGASNNKLSIVVSIGNAAYPSTTNRAWVSGGGEVNTSNNMGSVTTSVLAPDLTFAKTSLASFSIGTNVKAYRFVVSNIGTGAVLAGNVITIVDTLPVGATNAVKNSGSNWTVTFNAATRVMTATSNGTALNAGSSFQAVDIDVTFGSTTPASVTNTAYVSEPTEIITSNNSSSVTTPVTGVIDLALFKTSSTLFTPGSTGTYTLKVKNLGSLATNGTTAYTVTDTLPVGLTLASGTTTQNGWTITITNPSTRAIISATRTSALAVNDSSSFSVTPTVTTSAMPSVYNKAYVAGGNQQVTPVNDTASVVTPVATPDLTIVKTATTTFQVGSSATYRLTVKNTGNYLAVGPITVTDTLPTGLTYISASGSGWSTSANGQVVLGTFSGNIAASDSASFTINVTVLQAASPSVTNTARVSGGAESSTTNNSSTITTVVGTQPDLTVTKTASTTSFTFGSSASYTIRVKNIGTAPTSDTISVVDTLASGLRYSSGSGTGWTVSYLSGVVTAKNPGPIAIGDSVSFTITVIDSVTSASIGNTARVSGGGDANTSNNVSAITTTNLAADVTASKVAASVFLTGNTATYRIAVRNAGTAPTSGNIVVKDTLAAGLSFVSGTGSGWTVSASGQIVTATYSGAALAGANADSVYFILTVNVTASAGSTVDNTAWVSGGGEYNTTNDKAGPVATQIGGESDVTVAKVASAVFNRGGSGTYTITVTNIGTLPTSGTITVLDTLQAALSYVSGSGTGWSVSATGQVVTATYSGTALAAANGSTSFTLTVAVSSSAGSSVTNSAYVSGGGEVNTSNDFSGLVTTPIAGAPNITVVKSVMPAANIVPGSLLTYSISFTNGGNAAAVNVIITDDLPSQVQFKIGSIVSTFPEGITAVLQYYDGMVWTYTPISGGCSAPAGYDGCVTKVRWSLQSALPQTQNGTVSIQTRVK